MSDKITVLDNGYVQLVDYAPHPAMGMNGDMKIVMAARESYGGDMGSSGDNKQLLKSLYTNKHMTPFEMVDFTFKIRAPLVVWWQWVRYRTMSYNAQSGRYVPFKIEDCHVPTLWRKQAGGGSLSDSDSKLLSNAYTEHCVQSFQWYDEAIARGAAREQARLFLPAFGLYYTFWVKVNARNLMHFLEERLAKTAQYEIRMYAEAVMGIFEHKLPWTAECFKAELGRCQMISQGTRVN